MAAPITPLKDRSWRCRNVETRQYNESGFRQKLSDCNTAVDISWSSVTMAVDVSAIIATRQRVLTLILDHDGVKYLK